MVLDLVKPIDTKSLLRSDLEEGIDKILGVVGDVPRSPVSVVFSLQTEVGELSGDNREAVEGRDRKNKLMKEHSQRPKINIFVVSLPLDDLRREV